MSIVDTHILGEKPKRGTRVSQKQLDEYDRVERLVNEVQCDLVNGVLRSDIFRKFKEGLYENLGEKKIGDRQIQYYIKAAWDKMKEDRVDKVNELRDILFSQYMAIYQDSIEVGNSMAAKSCLDSIAKIFLPDEKNVNLNAKVEGDITIDFNLMEDEG